MAAMKPRSLPERFSKIVMLFSNQQQAEKAIQALVQTGVERDDVTIAMQSNRKEARLAGKIKINVMRGGEVTSVTDYLRTQKMAIRPYRLARYEDTFKAGGVLVEIDNPRLSVTKIKLAMRNSSLPGGVIIPPPPPPPPSAAARSSRTGSASRLYRRRTAFRKLKK
jgi:hypothetical protein